MIASDSDVELELTFDLGVNKRKGKMKKLYLAIALAGVLGAPSLQAAFSVSETSVNPGTTIGLTVTGGITYSGTVWAGVYNLLVNTVATPSFCIDVQRNSPSGTASYNLTTLDNAPLNVAGPMGTAAAAKIGSLWNTYFAPMMAMAAGTAKNEEAAALQIAIWQTVAAAPPVDGKAAYTVTVTAGTVANRAAYMFNNPGTGTANLAALVSGQYQNYVVQVGDNIPQPVPEPATLIAGALLLLPFGASALRIMRKNRKA